MIRKAYIEQAIPPNKYKVRIVELDGISGDDFSIAYGDLQDATVSILPSCSPNYNVGDVVFIDYERGVNPVIIGKLFLNNKEKELNGVDIKVNNIIIDNELNLNDKVTTENFMQLEGTTENIKVSLDNIKEKIDVLTNATNNGTLTNVALLNVENTFTMGQTISKATSGPILKLTSGATDTNFILERTGGSQCVLESGNSVGLFGTKTNHPLQVRTNYQNRMQFGVDGSVILATDVASNSNNNQLATTKWVNQKIATILTSISGYDATKTQVLKNINGVFAWVEE